MKQCRLIVEGGLYLYVCHIYRSISASADIIGSGTPSFVSYKSKIPRLLIFF